MEKNNVTSFFYYMWNAWNEVECHKAFKEALCGSDYLWEKWSDICSQYGSMAAVPYFYAAIDSKLKDMLVARAIEYYER